MFEDPEIDYLTDVVVAKKRMSAKTRRRAKIAAAAAAVGGGAALHAARPAKYSSNVNRDAGTFHAGRTSRKGTSVSVFGGNWNPEGKHVAVKLNRPGRKGRGVSMEPTNDGTGDRRIDVFRDVDRMRTENVRSVRVPNVKRRVQERMLVRQANRALKRSAKGKGIRKTADELAGYAGYRQWLAADEIAKKRMSAKTRRRAKIAAAAAVAGGAAAGIGNLKVTREPTGAGQYFARVSTRRGKRYVGSVNASRNDLGSRHASARIGDPNGRNLQIYGGRDGLGNLGVQGSLRTKRGDVEFEGGRFRNPKSAFEVKNHRNGKTRVVGYNRNKPKGSRFNRSTTLH